MKAIDCERMRCPQCERYRAERDSIQAQLDYVMRNISEIIKTQAMPRPIIMQWDDLKDQDEVNQHIRDHDFPELGMLANKEVQKR